MGKDSLIKSTSKKKKSSSKKDDDSAKAKEQKAKARQSRPFRDEQMANREKLAFAKTANYWTFALPSYFSYGTPEDSFSTLFPLGSR